MMAESVYKIIFLQAGQLRSRIFGTEAQGSPAAVLRQVGLFILCDVDTGLCQGAGVGESLTSSSKSLCFKILNFPPIS